MATLEEAARRLTAHPAIGEELLELLGLLEARAEHLTWLERAMPADFFRGAKVATP